MRHHLLARTFRPHHRIDSGEGLVDKGSYRFSVHMFAEKGWRAADVFKKILDAAFAISDMLSESADNKLHVIIVFPAVEQQLVPDFL